MPTKAQSNISVQTKCLTSQNIVRIGGSVIENSDYSVSVYLPNQFKVLSPVILTEPCCKSLNTNYFFDINTQTCKWGEPKSCDLNSVFKIILNPFGNDGSIFNVGYNQNCTLNVEFDYLLKIKCETLANVLIDNTSTVTTVKTSQEILTLIRNIQAQIITKTALCDTITNEISQIQKEIQYTPYSIECLSTQLNPNYCLTEPAGLNAWASILGPINYQNFLNGISTSYTCVDYQSIINLNASSSVVLINICKVPFGTKTDLINRLNQLLTDQQICQNDLKKLSDTLIRLQTSTTSTTTQINENCSKPIDVFESLDVSMVVDMVTSANTLVTVYTGDTLFSAIGNGNLYNYLTTNIDSGFYVCGDSSNNECIPLSLNLTTPKELNAYSCDSMMVSLINDLYAESGLSGTTNGYNTFVQSLPNKIFASKWLHYSTTITDPVILETIANNKIKISLKINHTCSDFCILLDNIVLNKTCTKLEKNDIFVTQSPGFQLDRIRDNKKSWIKATSLTNRDFKLTNNNDKTNSIRKTNYDVTDERLIINTKEIDLDISLASAIETDVWCYLVDNNCLLTGATYCDPCCSKSFQDDYCYEFMDSDYYDFMDFNTNLESQCCGDNQIMFDKLLKQPLSAITVVEDFQYYLTSELIDAKNRQTISGYPTLRALYDRYLNSYAYCGNNSSSFDYLTMDQFAGLLGDYWVDIVEQVVPSTAIWGSIKIYSNTIFDQQKYKYKSYSTLLCSNPFSGDTILSPINGITGQFVNANVTMTDIPISGNTSFVNQKTNICNRVCLAQMNHGSEFIGTVKVIGKRNTEEEVYQSFTGRSNTTISIG